MRLRLIAIAFAALVGAGPAAAEGVALTFDDLPTLSLSPSLSDAQTTTIELLDGLRRHRYPAIGFVNEIKLEGADKPQRIALLRAWLDAGMGLGNHSYSHGSLTKTPVEAYIADVQRGETITGPLLASRGKALRWLSGSR